MKDIFYITILLLLFGCSPEVSKILQYRDFLTQNPKIEIYYQDIVSKLGEPVVYKEHETDIVASWSRSFTTQRRLASDTGGEKIMVTFDKATKKMVKWEYKSW